MKSHLAKKQYQSDDDVMSPVVDFFDKQDEETSLKSQMLVYLK